MDSKITKADDEVQKLISKKRLKSVEDRRVASEIFDKITLLGTSCLIPLSYILSKLFIFLYKRLLKQAFFLLSNA